MAQHGSGVGLHLLHALGQAHAALAIRVVLEAAGTAAARMDLAFDHVDRAGQLLHGRLGSSGVAAT